MAFVWKCQLSFSSNDFSEIYGTYSNLVVHAESGDLTGYEFRFCLSKGRLKSIVQVSEGSAGNIYIVDVQKVGEDLYFDVPYDEGFVAKFSGKIFNRVLDGTLSLPNGEEEHVSMKRGRSFWDKSDYQNE